MNELLPGIGSTLPNMPMNDWECPRCGETNCDFINIATHCGACGLIVFHNDGDVVATGGFVDGYPPKALPTNQA